MIKLYTADEAATRRKIDELATLLNIAKRAQRRTRREKKLKKPRVMVTNISATVEQALDIAIAATQTQTEQQEQEK